MARPEAGFGKFLNLGGKSWAGQATAVPLPMIQNMKMNTPIPITHTASTFVINAAVNNPVNIWCGNDFIQLKETLTYTWATSATTIINSSGVTASSTVTGATIYYMYVGLDTAGAVQMYPSVSAPQYVEGPYQNGYWSHPGTARTKYWSYVGFAQCTATTPVFALLEKKGFEYYNPTPTAMGLTSAFANSTVAAAISLVGLVPVHDVNLYGWMVGVTGAATCWDAIGPSSLSAITFKVHNVVPTLSAQGGIANFGPIKTQGSAATLWAMSSATHAAGGSLNVTVIEDVV